jgi:16S rRNA (cytosine967-C5)-methyltransferase
MAAIIEANNARAPMSLRVNLAHGSRDAYLLRLEQAGIAASVIAHTEAGIQLVDPCEVTALSGFAEGDVSVQDAAAQQAAVLLEAKAGERILDACAAPGGKTAHILERLAAAGQRAEVWALDVDSERAARIGENLGRLGLQATVLVGDAASPAPWWDGKPFDRILLDAPCSATGVIRRHPDIRLLRRDSDIAQLANGQTVILNTLWSMLAPGGHLLYATCSMLAEENSAVITAFLAKQADANEQLIDVDWGRQCAAGRQVITGERDMDGFYYARLIKTA